MINKIKREIELVNEVDNLFEIEYQRSLREEIMRFDKKYKEEMEDFYQYGRFEYFNGCALIHTKYEQFFGKVFYLKNLIDREGGNLFIAEFEKYRDNDKSCIFKNEAELLEFVLTKRLPIMFYDDELNSEVSIVSLYNRVLSRLYYKDEETHKQKKYEFENLYFEEISRYKRIAEDKYQEKIKEQERKKLGIWQYA